MISYWLLEISSAYYWGPVYKQDLNFLSWYAITKSSTNVVFGFANEKKFDCRILNGWMEKDLTLSGERFQEIEILCLDNWKNGWRMY